MTKILLVEDDKSLREIYGVRLLAEGYDIVSAGDGEEALAMAIKERPQLIVSDVMMPKISGFDMLDILRSTTETKDIKVIMMTALSSEDQRARGEALGANRYLVKSQVGIEDVVRTVHEVLADAPVATPTPAQTFGPAAPSSTRPAAPTFAAPRPPQPTAAAPRPVAPSQPAAAPAPAPQQPAPSAPTPAPQTPPPAPYLSSPTTSNTSSLPQPTAPFSTARPANLGERVIHPISPQEGQKPDISSLMDQELGNTPTTPGPQAFSAPVQPAAPQAPSAPTPQPVVPSTPPVPEPPKPPVAPSQPSGISFEETPRTVTPPSGPFTPGPQPPAH